MSKESISSGYMERMKARHGHKKIAPHRNILITGAANSSSIGDQIIAGLVKQEKFSIFAFQGDVLTSDLNFDKITDLIMCHGVMDLNWLEEADESIVKNIIDVNLFGSIRMISNFVKDTLDTPYRKKIISIGSMAYNHVLNGSAAYCASKAGLAHYIKAAAWELAPKGYDVYCIHPSNTEDAAMSHETIRKLAKFRGVTISEAHEYWSANNPRNEFLSKEEISELVNFLLSGNTSYLSGANIELGGGQR